LETIVDLIRNYADGVHHEKEEQLLFPLMAEKGFSPQQGPVAVMLHEHMQGRQFVAGIRAGIELLKSGHENAVAIIYENMQGYVSLLRNHISKENNILFRMADQSFSEEEQAVLLKEFARVEQAGGAESIVPSYVSAIEGLAKKYLP
jgi:hemerythrin-like domain-containing protein